MNKKEIVEIKKTFKKDRNVIQRVCGCYVDAEKNKVLTFSQSFATMPEEEQFKYFEIFKKNLSGGIGNKLLNMPFTTDSELHGTGHKMLLQLRKSECKDEGLLKVFYDQIISHYLSTDPFIILLAFGAYDIPGQASDGSTMDDASDYVYSFLLCSICPMALSKPGLCYNAQKKAITDVMRDWMVGMPEQGFLWPAFNDRNTDLHNLLYYTKTPDVIDDGILEVLGCERVITASDQKAAFSGIVEDTLGDSLNLETVKDLQENLNKKIEDAGDENVKLDRDELRSMLAQTGADAEHLSVFDDAFDSRIGEKGIIDAENVAEKKLTIKSDAVSVSVKADSIGLLQAKTIDGRPCIVIAVTEDMDISGLHLTPNNISE